MLVDYSYYTNDYLVGKDPSIDEASFPFMAKKAELIIAQYTNGQYLNTTENQMIFIKDCACALAESLNQEATNSEGGGLIQSESVGGHSVSYTVKSGTQYASDREEIMRLYLWPIGFKRNRKVYGYEG